MVSGFHAFHSQLNDFPSNTRDFNLVESKHSSLLLEVQISIIQSTRSSFTHRVMPDRFRHQFTGCATVAVGSLVLPYSTAHTGLMLLILITFLVTECIRSWICILASSPLKVAAGPFTTFCVVLDPIKVSDGHLQVVMLVRSNCCSLILRLLNCCI